VGLKSSLGRIVNKILNPLGLEMRPTGIGSTPPYFSMPTSCQIPNISTIIENIVGKKDDGVFVEVGAFDGYTFSNTWGLATRGWSGLMFEPIPKFAAAARRRHKNHAAVKIVESAIGDREDTTIVLTLGGAVTTGSSLQLSEYQRLSWARDSLSQNQIVVPSTTLDCALTDHGLLEEFDVLVIDVEGLEEQVFAGFTLEKWRPKILIVELADMHPDLVAHRVSHLNLSNSILQSGYRVVYKDHINTVFARP
jgi:FkbM family methyltransferase